MRPVFIILIVTLLISTHVSSFAQDNQWGVLNPHQILSASVQNVEELPIINIDDKTRSLAYFDPTITTWATYNYPDGLKEIQDVEYNIRKRSDGTYIISPDGFFSGFSQNFIPDRWIFDPHRKSFFKLNTICINQIKALQGEDEWVVIDQGDGSYLCNTETGLISPRIPSLQADGYCAYSFRQYSVFSPDKTHLLFFCGGRKLSAFSYDIQKQIFLHLGDDTNKSDDNIEVIRWLNNNEAIIHSFPAPNPPSNAYYTANVTSPNSLQLIGSDMYLAPFYFDNPPHLEWMPCEFGACSPDVEMGFHYYDFVTHQMTIWPNLPMIEGESSLIPDGSGNQLYRHLNSTSPNAFFIYKAPSATLIRFDYETQKQAAIFTGEIEWIEGFSPNGRYVALQIGDDNEVASSALLAENQMHYRPNGHAEIKMLDLQTDTIVYEAKGNEWEEFSSDNPMPFRWLNNNTFLIQNTAGKSDQIIQIQPNTQVLAEYPAKSTLPSPNGDLVLVDNGNNRLAVYDVLAKRLISVIEQSLDQNIQINSKWSDVHSLLLTINRDHMILAQWIVRID